MNVKRDFVLSYLTVKQLRSCEFEEENTEFGFNKVGKVDCR